MRNWNKADWFDQRAESGNPIEIPRDDGNILVYCPHVLAADG